MYEDDTLESLFKTGVYEHVTHLLTLTTLT